MKDETDLHTEFSSAENTITQADAPQVSDYLDTLKGEQYDDFTLDEKIELLECIFLVMQSFVKIGHDLDPVNKLIRDFERSSVEADLLIDCEDATDEEGYKL